MTIKLSGVPRESLRLQKVMWSGLEDTCIAEVVTIRTRKIQMASIQNFFEHKEVLETSEYPLKTSQKTLFNCSFSKRKDGFNLREN